MYLNSARFIKLSYDFLIRNISAIEAKYLRDQEVRLKPKIP